jgi:N-acyl-D-amino-acid deacylase
MRGLTGPTKQLVREVEEEIITMIFDLVIQNGEVIDGTGKPRFRADLGLRKGKIEAIASVGALQGRETLDASGRLVVPGFIDIHSHFDWILPLPTHDTILAPMVLQGITTMLTGNCGSSPAPVTPSAKPLMKAKLGSYGVSSPETYYQWESMGQYLDLLEANGLLLNAAFLVGHGAVRWAVMGGQSGVPDTNELAVMRQFTRQAIREGAYGFSAGLGYAPGMFASNDEILDLLRTVVDEGGIYTVHGRAYSCLTPFYDLTTETPHNRISNLEQLDLARKSGVRLQLSHLIFHGRETWKTYPDVIQDVERGVSEGLDVAFDAFPYTYGNTTINVNFPAWFLDGFGENINNPTSLQRLSGMIEDRHAKIGKGYGDIILMWAPGPEMAELEGLDFTRIAGHLQMTEFEAYMHVARESRGTARILQDTYSGDAHSEEPLQAILTHRLCAFMTDTLYMPRGKQNPATFGTYPRLLGRYCRDLGLFTMEEVIRRMTSFPAERIGLRDLGRIEQGLWADLVIFDPLTVADNTTLKNSEEPPAGIDAVLISGQIVARHGQIVSKQRWGRMLRR